MSIKGLRSKGHLCGCRLYRVWKRECGSKSSIGLHPDTTTMALNYISTYGQVHSHPAGLGGVKSFKDPISVALVNTDSGISHSQADVIIDFFLCLNHQKA